MDVYRRELDRWMTLGVDVVSWGTSWEIAGVGVDNPSGSWLLISGIDQYVPPYTAGWRFPVKPKQAAITVRFVNSPSGSVSELSGNAPKLTISDQEYVPQQGTPTGAGARVAIVPVFSTIYDEVEADEPKNAPVAAMFLDLDPVPVILREISTAYNFLNGDFADGYYAPHTSVQTFWRVAANTANPPVPPYLYQWRQTISLETPYVSTPIPDGAVRIPAGFCLFVDPWTEPGGGREDIIIQAAYYEEAS